MKLFVIVGIVLAGASRVAGQVNSGADSFGERTALVGTSFTATANNTNASREPLEPLIFPNASGKTWWWTWTAPVSGQFLLSTLGSSFDTVLALRRRLADSSLGDFGSNNDGASSSGGASQLAITALAGMTYEIVVDGFGGASGNIRLNLDYNYRVTTLAGGPTLGAVDGAGAVARFNYPYGVAVDDVGNVYVADANNHAIRKITVDGVVTTLAGSLGSRGFADGAVSGARFSYPYGVSVDGGGNVYVADSGNNAIRRISAGGVVTTVAGSAANSGALDGASSVARFNNPCGVAVDAAGFLYVADTGNSTIRKITPAGVVSTLAGSAGSSGSADGTGGAARFTAPYGVAVDSRGNVIVANDRTIRKVAPDGVVSTLAGGTLGGSTDGLGSAASFDAAFGVAVDAAGNVYVANRNLHVIRKITSDGLVSTIAGQAGVSDTTDAVGRAARFSNPFGVAVDRNGKIYVADSGSHSIRVAGYAVAPQIQAPLPNQTVIAGSAATFAATATSVSPMTYQWRKNGVSIPGATAATYTIATPQAADAGTYSVVVTNRDGITTSAGSTLTIAPSTRIVNLSILTDLVSSGDRFTLGYVVSGNSAANPKPLVLRAVGPSLGALGVPGTLEDPRLELFAGAVKIGENDNWGGSAQLSDAVAAVGAFPFAGSSSRDAALAVAVTSSNNSVVVSAADSGTGTVIAEVYDATPAGGVTAATPRLVNVSVLKEIGSGFTVGFYIGGTGSKTVLMRAIGPGLAAVGVTSGTLADPRLALFAGTNKTDENDNWGGASVLIAAMNKVGAFPISNVTRDAALLATLATGAYSARIDGPAGATGVVLLEIYEVP